MLGALVQPADDERGPDRRSRRAASRCAPSSGFAVAPCSSSDLLVDRLRAPLAVERARERVRPEPEPDRQAAAAAATPATAAERPVPPRELDHRGARLGARTLDDPAAQRLRRRWPFGRVREGGDRLAEQGELLGAFARSLARCRSNRSRSSSSSASSAYAARRSWGRGSSGLRVIRPGRRSGSPRNSTAGDSALPARTRARRRGLRGRAPVRGGRPASRASVRPKPVVSRVIETRGERCQDPERHHRERLAVDRAHEQDADAGAAADAVEEADRRRRRAASCFGGARARRRCASADGRASASRGRARARGTRRGASARAARPRAPRSGSRSPSRPLAGRARAGRRGRGRSGRRTRTASAHDRRPRRGRACAASRARRSVDAISVVTAARWSGSVAWRSPSRIATATTSDERRAVGERSEEVVESEHGQLTFGRARTVMAAPAMTITRALSAGSRPITRPWSSKRRNVRLARIATSPIPVIESGEPRAERDDQRRARERSGGARWPRGARRAPTGRGGARRRCRRRSASASRAPRGWLVVVMVVTVAVRAAVPDAPEQHRGADADHEQPGDEPDPRVELLGDDELREPERHEAEREDADRVRRGDDQPERGRVAGLPALADEVRR